jgi:hypothetical protein
MAQEFSVEVYLSVFANTEQEARSRAVDMLAGDGYEGFEVKSARPTKTAYDVYADAKAAFYAAVERNHISEEPNAYLDAAIKALHQRQLDTVQLMSVWQDVKPYL